MKSSKRRYKTQVSYNVPGHAHYLTCSCYRRLALLNRDRSRRWFVDALERARCNQEFDLWAYVIMPEHIHLLIRPRRREYTMGAIEASFKRPISTAAKAHLHATGAARWLERLTVRIGNDRAVFRFWQAGPGFDRNLWSPRAIRNTIHYIHANPVRRGLVENPLDWRWSSARWWANGDSDLIAMDPIRLR